MISNWIHEENLKPLLETLSFLVGYDFDESDWTAIEIGTKNSNVENDVWYEYQLIGDQILKIKIALDNDAGLVFIQLDCSEAMLEKCVVALWIFQSYSLEKR